MHKSPHKSPRHRLQGYLLAGYTLFIAYVSLSPFSGWQKQGLNFIDALVAPLAQTFTWFDALLNSIAYVPLGFLFAHMLRYYLETRYILLVTMLAGLALSGSLEFAQIFLPTRVSSNSDILSNSIGTFCGAVLALTLARFSWFGHIENWYERWLHHGRFSDFGLALLLLWMFAQVNPSLPMLGSVFIGSAARWPFDIVQPSPLNWLECAGVSLNLVLLGILLSTLLRDRRHTVNGMLLLLCVVTLVKFVAAAVLLKSWALFLWINSEAMLGILAGMIVLVLALRLPPNWLFGFGAVTAALYFALVQNLLFGTPTSAVMRLYHWHYVHMLNYNGLSKMIILMFPIIFLVYLVRTRLGGK